MTMDDVINKYLIAREKKACLFNSTYYDPVGMVVMEYLGESEETGKPVERVVPRHEVEDWLNILMEN